jgi:16S rRNA (guanine527-N7)-methyltransferase
MRRSSPNTLCDGVSARVAELVARYDLSASQGKQMLALLAILAGDAHAPTAVTSPVRAVDVHLADALVALELHALRACRVLTDLGSGAGLPGLVLAVALPGTEVVLVESQARKCEFMRAAAATLGLENARVVCARAEDWRAGMSASNVAVARAVAAQPVVLEYAAPLLRMGGWLVDWRGKRDVVAEEAAMRAARDLGLHREEVRRVTPFAGTRDHHLHVFVKIAETPAGFPRRAGMARKRPLGSFGGPECPAEARLADEQPRNSDRR